MKNPELTKKLFLKHCTGPSAGSKVHTDTQNLMMLTPPVSKIISVYS